MKRRIGSSQREITAARPTKPPKPKQQLKATTWPVNQDPKSSEGGETSTFETKVSGSPPPVVVQPAPTVARLPDVKTYLSSMATAADPLAIQQGVLFLA